MSPRVMPENRIPDIIRAAAGVFSRKGYRMARLEEIAKEANVSKAGLYYYFKNKAHLFYYVLENGLPKDGIAQPMPEDSPKLTEQQLLDLLKNRLRKDSRLASIKKALSKKESEIDVAREVAEIVEEMWDLLEGNRVQIIILEKSALEFPELAMIYDKHARGQVLRQLEQYLENRIRFGVIRPVASVAVVSRTIMESLSWFGFKQTKDLTSPIRYPKSEAVPELTALFARGLKK